MVWRRLLVPIQSSPVSVWPKAAIALGQRLNRLEMARSVVRKSLGRLSQVDPVALVIK